MSPILSPFRALMRLVGDGGVASVMRMLRQGRTTEAIGRVLVSQFAGVSPSAIERAISLGQRIVRMIDTMSAAQDVPLRFRDIPIRAATRVPNRPFDRIRYDMVAQKLNPRTRRIKEVNIPVYSPRPLAYTQVVNIAHDRAAHIVSDTYDEIVGISLVAVSQVRLTKEEREILRALRESLQ